MLRKLVVHKINENKNKVRLGKKHIEKFADILKEFKRKCYFYPTNEQGLSALIKVPTTSKKCRRYPKNGFAKGKNNLNDIWGNRYLYQRVGNHFYVKSLGADGETGGSGINQDLIFPTYRTFKKLSRKKVGPSYKKKNKEDSKKIVILKNK